MYDILDDLAGDILSDDLPGGFAGMGSTTMATLTTSNITCNITAWIRPDRLVLNAAGVVDLMLVNDIKVGTISLNVGTTGAAARCFAHDAVGTRLKASVIASPSVPPVVVMYNGTAGSVTVSGGIFGPVSRTDPGRG